MFNPSQKSSQAVVQSQAESILQSTLFSELLRQAPNVIMILNTDRQVVYLNRNPVDPGEALPGEATGQRPGECLGCINISKGELGCGSSAFCRVCGFNAAITASEGGKAGRDECNISLKSGTSLTLSVNTRPFVFGGETFIFCALEDISEKKRREMLEGIFLHDILNTAAVLGGLSEAFDELRRDDIKALLDDVSTNLNEEVQSYRLISNAETQTLKPNFTSVSLEEITEEVVRSLLNMQKFRDRDIRLRLDKSVIITERTLLRRVMINMVKNALEAAGSMDAVEVSCAYDKRNMQAEFSVRNPQHIPKNNQLKLFQKSFSTKGRGRGWGTYSIKILTEKYLKGSVSFQSDAATGTTFTILIPSLPDPS